MNDIHVHPVNAAGKKEIRSPAVRALAVVVGLALLLPGLALAGDPIPGVDVKLGKNPGGSIVASSQTDSQGNFHFDKLPAGNYTLKLPGLPDQSFTVGAEGSISAVLSKEPDGTASISVNEPSGLADHGTRLIRITNVRANANQLGKANQPIITKDVDNLTTQVGSTSNNLPGLGSATRSNKKAGIAKAEEPTPDGEGVLPGKTGHAPKPVSPGTGPHGSLKAEEPIPDEKPGISDQGAAGGLISYGTAPPPKDAGKKAGIKMEAQGQNDSEPQPVGAQTQSTVKAQDDVITVKGKTAGKPGSFGSGMGHGAASGMGSSGGMGGSGMSPGMIPGAGGPMGAPGPSPSPMGSGMGGPGSPMRP